MSLVAFVGGGDGPWRVESMDAVTGASLPAVGRLDVLDGAAVGDVEARWILRGVTSYERYTHRNEQESLAARQPPLGRSASTCAALIPITKSAAWWRLAQDQRREIFEESSHHIAIGQDYLPAVARRLYHSRDLAEPFDFLTWFEYAPEDAASFDRLVDRLRATPEWEFVEREIDIRLTR